MGIVAIIISFLEEGMNIGKNIGFISFIIGVCVVLALLGAGACWLGETLFSNSVKEEKSNEVGIFFGDANVNGNNKEEARVLILDDTKKISKGYFSSFAKLREVYFSNDDTEIEGYVFAGCVNLRIIELPQKLKEIKPYTFAFCESLEKIKIPDSVEKIGKNAFKGCKKLSSLNIAESIISEQKNWLEIEDEAFSGIPANCILKFDFEKTQLVKDNYKKWGLSENHKVQFGEEKEITIKELMKKSDNLSDS